MKPAPLAAPPSPSLRDDVARPVAWSTWTETLPAGPVEIVDLVDPPPPPAVAVETCCSYCRREDEQPVTCFSCKRPLCSKCRKGLCAKSRCMPRPQGDGVA